MKNLTEKQKVVVALKIAKDLNLNHYTSGTFARDAAGNEVCSDSRKACRWCAHGARTAAVVYVGLDFTGRCRVTDLMSKAGVRSTTNDHQPELLPDAWDRAIALAESEVA